MPIVGINCKMFEIRKCPFAKVPSECICTEILDLTSIGNHRSVVYKFYKFEINSLISFLCAVLSSSRLLFLYNITRLLSLVL